MPRRRAPSPPAVPASADQAFALFFYGTDLSVWLNSGGSREVVDAEIRAHRGRNSIIQTSPNCGDFVLRFEYKLSPGTVNGVGIRMPLGGEGASAGIEIQLVDESDLGTSK